MTISALLRKMAYSLDSIALAAALLFVPTFSFAAETATLSGIVRDPSDAAIASAAVTIREQSTGTERRTSTNTSGLFTAPALQAGTYTIVIAAQGFKTIESADVQLSVAEVKQIDFTLEVGDVAQTISVDGSSPMLNSSDGSVGMTIDSRFVSNLPLNGRSFQQLISLAPGVNYTGSAHDYGEFSINGQRATSNYFTVDGVSANLGSQPASITTVGEGQNAAGGMNALVAVDALQEFRILTSSFAPEYGRTPGGQIVLLTRSGTNTPHATLFEYFRNDVLDANDWFANRQGASRSPLRFNDFGGTVGGPITKNKTFFFFSYEGQRLLQPQFTVVSEPDSSLRHAAPTAVQPLLNAFPLPNGPTLAAGQGQFSAGYSNPITTDALSVRVDHQVSDSLNGFFRFNYSPSSSVVRTGGLSTLTRTSYNTVTYTGGLTYILSPSTNNDLRANYSASQTAETFSLDTFGGATPIDSSTLFVTPNTPRTAWSYVSLWSGTYIADGSYSGLKQRTINLVDSLSHIAGRHQIKLGADYLRSLPIYFGSQINEDLFNGPATVQSGTLASFVNEGLSPARADATTLSLYAQDAWRIAARTTVTYGVRWDFNPPPRDRDPNNGNYIPLLGDYATGSVYIGSVGSTLYHTRYTNFAPRFGIAYQIRRAHGSETVVRLGGGLFYDSAQQASLLLPFSSGYPHALVTRLSNVMFPIDSVHAALPSTNLTTPPSSSSFVSYAIDLRSPATWQWNVSLQQALGASQTITASYVGATGVNLLYGQTYAPLGQANYSLRFTSNAGTSTYHALQLQFERRVARHITATANYTWSHSEDDDSADLFISLPTTRLRTRDNWGPSDFDVRHNMSAAISWSPTVPAGTSWLAALGRNWGLDAVLTTRSGLPLDVEQSVVTSFGSFYLRPDVVPGVPVYLYGTNYPGGRALNAAAFKINPNSQGDLGRNAFRGFGLLETDLSVRRTFHLTEAVGLMFRTDLFNALNHPNFANPYNYLGSGTFGVATSLANSALGGGPVGSSGYSLNSLFQSGGPRSIQVSLRLTF